MSKDSTESLYTKAQTDAMIGDKLFPVTNMGLESLESVTIPNAAISFDASNNKLVDFTGFNPTDNIKHITFDNNPLLSFKGFPSETKIVSFSAKNSPISQMPNYRQLTLLAIGPQLTHIDGVKVTAVELNSVSARKLAEKYDRTTSTKYSDGQLNNIYETITDAVRRGYVFTSLPKSLKYIESDAFDQENDPVPVRVVRLFTLLRKTEDQMLEFFKNFYEEPTASKYKQVSKQQQLDEQMQRQLNLIIFMKDQLDILQTQKQEKFRMIDNRQLQGHTPKSESIFCSKNSENMYSDMLSKHAQALEHNAQLVERNSARYNPDGLRSIVSQFFGYKEVLPDRELIRLLSDGKGLNESFGGFAESTVPVGNYYGDQFFENSPKKY